MNSMSTSAAGVALLPLHSRTESPQSRRYARRFRIWCLTKSRTITLLLFSLFLLSSFAVYSSWFNAGVENDEFEESNEGSSGHGFLKRRSYSIVLDAGSSGTRLQLYSYHFPVSDSVIGRSYFDTLPVVTPTNVTGDWQKKVTPGLSTFGTLLYDDIENYLKPLIEFAMKNLPSSVHHSTPLYLYATAGMRLLPLDQQHHVLSSTCSALRKLSPFVISDCQNQIKVISGEHEGLYGWLTVNYLLKGFNRDPLGDADPSSTFGFMDMGGASAQIAYVPEKQTIHEHMDDLQNVTLVNSIGESVTYHIFVTTFLGYGANEARRRYIEHLVTDGTKSHTNLTDPCLPKGRVVQPHTPINATLVGSGHFEQCVINTYPVLNKTATCPNKPCLFSGQHTPGFNVNLGRGFIGVSELWYTTHNVALDVGNELSVTQIDEKSNEFCEMEWNTILTKYKEKEQEDRLESQCFKAAWVLTMLKDGLGLKERPRLPDGPKKRPLFQPADEINGISISWTLGATFYHALQNLKNELMNQNKHVGNEISTSEKIIALVVGVIVTVFLTILGIQWVGRRQSRYGGVQAWLRQRQSGYRFVNTSRQDLERSTTATTDTPISPPRGIPLNPFANRSSVQTGSLSTTPSYSSAIRTPGSFSNQKIS